MWLVLIGNAYDHLHFILPFYDDLQNFVVCTLGLEDKVIQFFQFLCSDALKFALDECSVHLNDVNVCIGFSYFLIIPKPEPD